MIQEFDISITAVGDDKYLVRTESFAPGVPLAEEQLQWPVDQWLQQARLWMHDPLLGLAKGQSNLPAPYRSGQPSPATGSPIVSLGQDLYRQLFQGLLRDSWLAAQGVAQNRGYLLRLRLGLKDARLQQLPWEVLHGGDRPLATGTDITFSRYHSDRRRTGDYSSALVPDLSQPLRVLMAIAAPTDQDRLDLEGEVYDLQTELHRPTLRSGDPDPDTAPSLDIQLTILKQPGRAELTQALEQGNFQVFHYSGHSNLGNAGGDLYLVSRQTGLTERLSGEDLAGLLVNNGVKLAVFNSCRGAYTAVEGSSWQEQNLAQALVGRGVPSVVAMAEQIPDDVAISFTKLLYRNLKQGHPIDLCLNRTRQGLISVYESKRFYWALPILYMQPSFNGYLTGGDRVEDALDQLLFRPPGTSLADLAQPRTPIPPPDELPIVPVPDLSTADGSAPADLEHLVETLETEDLLTHSEDSDLMAELVERLSDPFQLPTALTDAALPESPSTSPSEPLPEPLSTPGLSIYDELPAASVRSPAADAGGAQADLAPAALAEPVTPRKSWWQRRPAILTAGALGAVAIASLVAPRLVSTLSDPQRPSPGFSIVDSPFAQTEQALGSENYAAAADGLGALLRQDKPRDLLDLLDAYPSAYLNSPEIAFLRGRAQWELYRQNSPDFSADDARQNWQLALELAPNWPDALVALGFAHFALGNLDEAEGAWLEAIEVSDRRPYTPDSAAATLPGEDSGLLNAYAGLAMVHYAYSEIQIENAEADQLLQLALKEKNIVISQAETAFLSQNLGRNWLWSLPTIEQWSATKTALDQYAAAQ